MFEAKLGIKYPFYVIYELLHVKSKLFMAQQTHHYSNGEITVVWKPGMCIHAGICFKGLAPVFDPRRKPWIDMSKAETQQIIDQVKKRPSGALSIEKK